MKRTAKNCPTTSTMLLDIAFQKASRKAREGAHLSPCICLCRYYVIVLGTTPTFEEDFPVILMSQLD